MSPEGRFATSHKTLHGTCSSPFPHGILFNVGKRRTAARNQAPSNSCRQMCHQEDGFWIQNSQILRQSKGTLSSFKGLTLHSGVEAGLTPQVWVLDAHCNSGERGPESLFPEPPPPFMSLQRLDPPKASQDICNP